MAYAEGDQVHLQADLTSSPKQAEDGKLWTPGAVEFFRIVNEQVGLVEEATNGEMLALEGAAVLAVMKDFQVRFPDRHVMFYTATLGFMRGYQG